MFYEADGLRLSSRREVRVQWIHLGVLVLVLLYPGSNLFSCRACGSSPPPLHSSMVYAAAPSMKVNTRLTGWWAWHRWGGEVTVKDPADTFRRSIIKNLYEVLFFHPLPPRTVFPPGLEGSILSTSPGTSTRSTPSYDLSSKTRPGSG